MQLLPPDVPLSFDVTFGESGLAVAMSVYDITGAPALVQGPSAMANVVAGTYVGKFTGTNGRSYLIFKAVYTDGTFTTLSPDFSQGSETIIVETIGGGGGGSNSGTIIGIVNDNLTVVGHVNC